MNLRGGALECLKNTDALVKSLKINTIFNSINNGTIIVDPTEIFNKELFSLGRPSKPELVEPFNVKRRSMASFEGRASLVHALAHIEFNAINLSLDAVWRFSNMPEEFYINWFTVAKEEAHHFNLLNEYLIKKKYCYGDFSAHNSLWEMVEKTSEDILARMALVPRTMEARGLDAIPAIRGRFFQAKDLELVNILDLILQDEVSHVYIGNYWFNYLCVERKIDPIKTYKILAKAYNAPTLRGPLNMEARLKAGFTQHELDELVKT